MIQQSNRMVLPIAPLGARKTRPWQLVGAIAALCGPLASACVLAAEPQQVRAAAQKSLNLLQRCDPEFFRQTGCVACHQHTVTSLAVAEARRRGLQVDEQSAREQLQITALVVKSARSRLLQRVDHPLNSAPAAGYIALGLAVENYPADESTDALIIELAGRQTPDGSWTAFGHRPPLEYSRVSATALAVHAMKSYGPPGLKEPLNQRIDRARKWLTAIELKANSEQVFRLLGLAWSGGDKNQIQAQTNSLAKQQHDDGGWSELPEMAGDAYATAMTLYALREGGGIAAADPVYMKGVEYLLRTQLDDGSWHVKSRALPFQPYFESGFPHGHDQWISAAATGFAAVALMSTLPQTGAGSR
jgi:Prenyltransferase and squalene oxidase repeat